MGPSVHPNIFTHSQEEEALKVKKKKKTLWKKRVSFFPHCWSIRWRGINKAPQKPNSRYLSGRFVHPGTLRACRNSRKIKKKNLWQTHKNVASFKKINGERVFRADFRYGIRSCWVAVLISCKLVFGRPVKFVCFFFFYIFIVIQETYRRESFFFKELNLEKVL